MKIRNFLTLSLSSFFFVGYLPLIPGTFGSLAGVFLFLLIKGNALHHLLLTLAVTLLGFFICGMAERIGGKKDPRHIVLDEVSGMLLSLFFIPYDIKLVILGFFVFRLLDSLKPFPAGLFEKMKGSLGIMSDDIIAAIYTNIVLQLFLRFASFKAS